jgi:hypothetical protein
MFTYLLYKVIREENLIFWKIIISVIGKKKVHMSICTILKVCRVKSSSLLYRAYCFNLSLLFQLMHFTTF